MKSKIDLWANKHTSRYLFSGTFKKKKQTDPLICNCLNFHEGLLATAEVFCKSGVDLPVFGYPLLPYKQFRSF